MLVAGKSKLISVKLRITGYEKKAGTEQNIPNQGPGSQTLL